MTSLLNDELDEDNLGNASLHLNLNTNHKLTNLKINKQYLSLDFEFSFFKLIKTILIDFNYNDYKINTSNHFTPNEYNLNLLMNFCLNECIKQFDLFNKSNFLNDTNDQFDEDYDLQDEFNLIELIFNFHTNLLNILHSFKEVREKLLSLNDAHNVSFGYYDLMSSLISIYLDIGLQLKFKIEKYKFEQFAKRNFKNGLCLNVFYLLDSCAYYVYNTLLQLTNLTEKNCKFIIPIVQKLIDVQSNNLVKTESDSNQNGSMSISCSLYLRMLLVYRKISNLFINSDSLFQFFLNFILSISIPSKFKSFVIKLLNKYSNQSELAEFKSKLCKLETNRRVRKSILFKLNNEQLDYFIKALHNRTVKDKSAIPKIEINRLLSRYEKTDSHDKKLIKPCSFNHNGFTSNGFTFNQKLNAVCKVKIKPIDLSKYKKLSNYTYLLESPATNLESTISSSNEQFENSDEEVSMINRTSKLSTPISNEKFAMRPSPNPFNISKLNFFRNIYEEENYKLSEEDLSRSNLNNSFCSTIASSTNYSNSFSTISHDSTYYHRYSSSLKYYKLSDLVSVMVNEDYLKDNVLLTPDDSMDKEGKFYGMVTSTPNSKFKRQK